MLVEVQVNDKECSYNVSIFVFHRILTLLTNGASFIKLQGPPGESGPIGKPGPPVSQ